MGFMDKAKKLAEQAQQKIDEAQTQFNQSHPPGGTAGGAVEYDQHGRPIPSDPASATPAPVPASTPPPPEPDRPHGDPLADAVPTEAPTAPGPPPADAPPAARGSQGAPADRNNVDYTPPQVTSGDPLAS
jgi:hypothetical protein